MARAVVIGGDCLEPAAHVPGPWGVVRGRCAWDVLPAVLPAVFGRALPAPGEGAHAAVGVGQAGAQGLAGPGRAGAQGDAARLVDVFHHHGEVGAGRDGHGITRPGLEVWAGALGQRDLPGCGVDVEESCVGA